MKPVAKSTISDAQTIHMLPHWVTSAQNQTPDTVAFTSGAALAILDVVVRDPYQTAHYRVPCCGTGWRWAPLWLV